MKFCSVPLLAFELGFLAPIATFPAAAAAETNHRTFSFDQIGAVAGKQYSGDGLAAAPSPPVTWMPQATNTPVYQSLAFTNVSPSPQGFYRMRYVP